MGSAGVEKRFGAAVGLLTSRTLSPVALFDSSSFALPLHHGTAFPSTLAGIWGVASKPREIVVFLCPNSEEDSVGRIDTDILDIRVINWHRTCVVCLPGPGSVVKYKTCAKVSSLA